MIEGDIPRSNNIRLNTSTQDVEIDETTKGENDNLSIGDD
jgi:hypothetical protein